MGQNEKLVLRYAYDNYLKTGDFYFVYHCSDSTEWFRVVEGMHYLYESGLVNEVPEIVKRGYGSAPMSLDIDGNITDRGIEKARLEWEFKD